jgi:hypothetical protein
MAYQRYAHAKQFRRANRALRSVRSYLGRVLRDIGRKTRDDANLRPIFAEPCEWPFGCAISGKTSAAGRGRDTLSMIAIELTERILAAIDDINTWSYKPDNSAR